MDVRHKLIIAGLLAAAAIGVKVSMLHQHLHHGRYVRVLVRRFDPHATIDLSETTTPEPQAGIAPRTLRAQGYDRAGRRLYDEPFTVCRHLCGRDTDAATVPAAHLAFVAVVDYDIASRPWLIGRAHVHPTP